MAKAPIRLLEKLRDCKVTGTLRKSLFVDYTTGSDFQILEWAGDRHLKSLLAEIVMNTSRGLKDQGELSALCQACEKTTALAKVFELAELAKLVDEGTVSTEQVGDAEKRKADVVEAVIAELHQKREANGTAQDALQMLVAFIYDIGSRSMVELEFRKPNDRSNGDMSSQVGANNVAPVNLTSPNPQQPNDKNAVSKLHEWSQRENKKLDFPCVQLDGGAWRIEVQIEGALLEGVIGEHIKKQDAKMKAAEQALIILNAA